VAGLAIAARRGALASAGPRARRAFASLRPVVAWLPVLVALVLVVGVQVRGRRQD
jgi:hypothetical protein